MIKRKLSCLQCGRWLLGVMALIGKLSGLFPHASRARTTQSCRLSSGSETFRLDFHVKLMSSGANFVLTLVIIVVPFGECLPLKRNRGGFCQSQVKARCDGVALRAQTTSRFLPLVESGQNLFGRAKFFFTSCGIFNMHTPVA